MNSPIIGLRAASIVFGLIAIAQAARLVLQPQILVAGHEMPLWPSVIALLILGAFSFWMWVLASLSRK